ncbi:MAG TPA: molybdate ABC transporter substrate-binding protein [Chloroflexaceae bacterium]|nr:molybdate ABC transporter substrate-binding protein [Chloroflexaceae bacterium]
MSCSPVALLVLALALLLAACGGAPAASQPTSPPAPTDAPTEAPAEAATTGEGALSVFAAASLADAFEELATAFEAANPGVEVVYNFAGSQQLAAQINEGAPADVFASANRAQMQTAIDGGRIDAGSEQTFVRNRLVVIPPADNPAGVETLQDLATPGLRLILADVAVPVGQYSLDVLARASALPDYTANYSPTVLANVVSYEDNVRAVLTKVALGEGDAGIVYTTDAALDADNVRQIGIPDELNTIANYPVAPLNDSPNAALAEAFIAYLLSPEAQAVLTRYGFISPAAWGGGAPPVAAAVP